MPTPYLGQIAIFPYATVPPNFTPCNGQRLQIVQNSALFAVLGTMYGGDGISTFALPDLRSRVVLGQAQGPPGQKAGEESVALTVMQMPVHGHEVAASSEPTTLQHAAAGTSRHRLRATDTLRLGIRRWGQVRP